MPSISEMPGTERFARHTVTKRCPEERNESQEDLRQFQLQKYWV